jgi:hypothetical protein
MPLSFKKFDKFFSQFINGHVEIVSKKNYLFNKYGKGADLAAIAVKFSALPIRIYETFVGSPTILLSS